MNSSGNLTLKKAFSNADEVLCTAAKGIAEVITLTGDINVDMNDVKTVMRDSPVPPSWAQVPQAVKAGHDGRDRSPRVPAAQRQRHHRSQLRLLNITYGTEEVLMDEISEITDYIQDQAGATAEVIWGYGHDASLEDKICVTVIATGFETRADLPEEPTISRCAWTKGPGEITAPLNGPVETTGWTADASPTAATPQNGTHCDRRQQRGGATSMANQWEVEDITSETPNAALDLFGKTDAVEEVSLKMEEATPEAALTEDVPTAEADTPETPSERVGGFTVLDLDDTQDDALLPEGLEGVSFTNEQVTPTENTGSHGNAN